MLKAIGLYFAVISAVSVIMTVLDKHFAVRGKWRISENALMCAAALGGSAAMYLTMRLIHHKTRHVKFMAGLPLVMVIQIIFAAFILLFLRRNMPV